MFYWNKNDPRVHFNDLRSEEKELCDGRKLIVSPDTNWDFTDLPVPSQMYYMVVFDPPHLLNAGENSWLKAKYGVLPDDWKHFIKQGFDECMRVLKPNGTLIMKWSSNQIPAKDVLKAIGVKPILGTRKSKKNYWWVFMKEDTPRKPKGISITWDCRVANCPACNAFIREIEDENQCHKCGQRLDWSKDD